MGLVRFDPTINVGHMLTVTVLIMGGLATFSSIQSVLSSQEVRLKSMENTIAALRDLSTIVASDRVKIDNLETIVTGTADTNRQMLEKLSAISADVAVLKAFQSSDRPVKR